MGLHPRDVVPKRPASSHRHTEGRDQTWEPWEGHGSVRGQVRRRWEAFRSRLVFANRLELNLTPRMLFISLNIRAPCSDAVRAWRPPRSTAHLRSALVSFPFSLPCSVPAPGRTTVHSACSLVTDTWRWAGQPPRIRSCLWLFADVFCELLASDFTLSHKTVPRG